MIKNNLKEIRKRKGMTQRDLADMLGWRYEALVNQIESGQEPRIGKALKIARVLNMKVEEIWEDDKKDIIRKIGYL